jgi:hypothetical protein
MAPVETIAPATNFHYRLLPPQISVNKAVTTVICYLRKVVCLDRGGTPVFRIEGEASKKDISARVEWLLSERTEKQPKILIKNY